MTKHPRAPNPYQSELPTDLEFHSDMFIIPAKDEEGASIRCQFSCSPRLHAWISDMVDSKKFPFRRDGDLLRWAAYYGMVILSRIERSVPSQQAALDVCHASVRRSELRADTNDHVERLETTMDHLVRHKAWGEIVTLLSLERRSAKSCLEIEPFWAQRWLELLDEKFSHIETMALSQLEFVQWAKKQEDPKEPPTETGKSRETGA